MSIKSRLSGLERKTGSTKKRYEGFKFQFIISGRTNEEVRRKVREEIQRRRKAGIDPDDPDVPDIVAIYRLEEPAERKDSPDPEGAV